MSGFDKYDLATRMSRLIQKVAKDEVEKQRPPLRTARVDEIFPNEEFPDADKYAMVTYIGETTSVRVPYNNAIPSFIGQYVRIGGTVSDRRIEEILGDTLQDSTLADLQERIATLEAIPRPGEFFFETSFSGGSWRSTSTPEYTPMRKVTEASLNGFLVHETGVECRNAGRYYCYGQWYFTNSDFTGGVDVNIEVQILNELGQVKLLRTSRINENGAPYVGFMAWLDVGDYVRLFSWSGRWRDHSSTLSPQYNRMGAFLVNNWTPPVE